MIRLFEARLNTARMILILITVITQLTVKITTLVIDHPALINNQVSQRYNMALYLPVKLAMKFGHVGMRTALSSE